MLPSLHAPFQKLEAIKQLIIRQTAHYAAPQRAFKPSPDAWSVNQLIKHLEMVEQQVLIRVQKRLERGTLKPETTKSWLRYMTVKLALRYRKKIQTPPQLAHPPDNLTFEQVQLAWEQTREQWRQTLDKFSPDMLKQEVFKHPLAGYMTISQTLRFMHDHHQHHLAQLKRIAATMPPDLPEKLNR